MSNIKNIVNRIVKNISTGGHNKILKSNPKNFQNKILKQYNINNKFKHKSGVLLNINLNSAISNAILDRIKSNTINLGPATIIRRPRTLLPIKGLKSHINHLGRTRFRTPKIGSRLPPLIRNNRANNNNKWKGLLGNRHAYK